jgi:signal transduction histidine kinase
MASDPALFCSVAANTLTGREQERLLCLDDSGWLSAIPEILPELLETAVKLLEFPIAWVSLMERDALRFQGTYGLSTLGLTHALSSQRAVPRSDTFCTYVVDSQKVLGIEDTWQDAVFGQTVLAQTYGIRAYLGAPLLFTNENGDYFCLGTLALLDPQPRSLGAKDRQWIQVLARWCESEYARSTAVASLGDQEAIPDVSLRLQTIYNLAQECQNPMTAIIGMGRMLSQEIYGPLTPKQREYIDIINHSSQTLLLQTQEIQSLSSLPEEHEGDCILPTDLALVSQNLIQQLHPIAQENRIDLDFSSETPSILWYGNPDPIHQILNHLLQGAMSLTTEPGTLHLHLSCPEESVKFTLWFLTLWVDNPHPQEGADLVPMPPVPGSFPLRLKFCQQVVEQLAGTFEVESTPDMGKRYTVILPMPHLNVPVVSSLGV